MLSKNSTPKVPDTLSIALEQCVNYLQWEMTPEEVRANLLGMGLSEYQAWLTYKGAQLIIQNG